MEMARVTAKGQITVPIDVRRRLGLNEGSRMLFIESDNGFLTMNANRVDFDLISGTRTKAAHSWSDEYIKDVMAFGDTPDETFIEREDLPWTARDELL